jgi:hypothetical protein
MSYYRIVIRQDLVELGFGPDGDFPSDGTFLAANLDTVSREGAE